MRNQKSSSRNSRSTKRPARKSARKSTTAVQGITFEQLETRQLMATVNVADFGARPNDGANDLAAVKAAINASKPGDTVLFSGGTFDFSDEFTVASDRTYQGANGATLKGRGAKGQLIQLHGNNVKFTGLTFEGGGVFVDSAAGGMNQNITFDFNTFKLNTSGEHPSGITFTSGLANSKITNNYFTGYNAGFGIYGYNYNGLTIANNEFINIRAGMHIDAFGNSGNLLVEQNYISGAMGMGMEFQSSATNLTFQDNWYENPNLSTNFSTNNNSMAYSLILDKSSNINIRRNVVIAPQRPDGVGTRIGFEVGGDNTLVEDNYVNGVNHVLAMNDGVGSASVNVRNNKFMNYLQGWSNSFPASNRTWQNVNNGPNTRLSDTMESRIAANAKPGIGNKRYGSNGSNNNTGGSPVVTPPPVESAPTVDSPAAPTGLTALVTGASTVNLFWTDRAYNEAGYTVQQSTDGKTWTQVAKLGADAAGYAVKGLIAGKTYSFRVGALGADNDAAFSTTATVKVEALDVSRGTYVSDMDWAGSTNFWGQAERDSSNGENVAGDGRQLVIGGKKFVKGVGVHAGSEIKINLNGNYSTFLSTIGLDDETDGQGSVRFEVWADGKRLYASGEITGASGRKNISVDVSGKKQMTLIVTNAEDNADFDHADWADARLLSAEVAAPVEPANPSRPPTTTPASGVVYLSDMDWDSYSNGWGTPEKNRSNGNKGRKDGGTITLNGKTYAKGIGAHSTGDIRYNLGGKYSSFTADIGIDDEVGDNGSVIFQVFADGEKLFDSGLMTGASDTQKISVNVQGKQELWLVVLAADGTRDYDHADWADAKLTVAPGKTLPAGTYLSDLQTVTQSNGWGPIELDSSIGEKAADDGSALTLNRRVYTKGLGVHSNSKLVYNLNGQYTTFITDLGLDDEVGNNGSVVFQIFADGAKVYDSGTMTGASATKTALVNVDGVKQLWLVVTDAGDDNSFDHANWANARVIA